MAETPEADKPSIVTAAVIIIGNEVLSGRIPDANLHFIATSLKGLGVRLQEARVIPDVEDVIVAAVNELRVQFDYVFTTGGIGPTHDDITAASVSKAFDVPLERNARVVALLEAHYTGRASTGQVNDARLRMANIPRGASLLENPVSKAPGFRIENVFVLPGVPRIMQAIFDGFKHDLVGGDPVLSRTVTAFLSESVVAIGLEEIENTHASVEIGSYPFVRAQRFGCALVVRTTDAAELEAATEAVAALVRRHGVEPEIADGESPP